MVLAGGLSAELVDRVFSNLRSSRSATGTYSLVS